MNHKHECYFCHEVDLCDWGYHDDECAIHDEPTVICAPCSVAFKGTERLQDALSLGIRSVS